MKKFGFLILVLPLMVTPLSVSADEYVISGNGSGSDNSISATQETTNTVEQQNTAEVNNNVDVNANTGGNEANHNTGEETKIDTGNIEVTSDISNAGINQNHVEAGCCQNSTNIDISGNGAKSDNNVTYNNNSNTNVSVNNSASISNNVNGTANTGENKANYNNGSVYIATGDIKVIDNIKNDNVNNYSIKVTNNSGGNVSISIKDNGTYSDNVVILNNNNNVEVEIKNEANILNSSTWYLNTGGNEAIGNTGDVTITTGDILFASNIDNSGINTGIVDIDCCDDDDNPNPPDPTPPNPPSSGGGGSSGGSGGSSSGGGSSNGGPTLPVTGALSLMVLAIVVTIMFFLGWYLRLRSGRSPNIAF